MFYIQKENNPANSELRRYASQISSLENLSKGIPAASGKENSEKSLANPVQKVDNFMRNKTIDLSK